MRLIELKFFLEEIDEKKEKMIEVCMLGNPVMKYIVKDIFFEKKITKSIDGKLPVGIKSILKMKMGG